MLLGKRQRPPIKRTTSMKEITLDISNIQEADGVVKQRMFDLNNPFHGLDPAVFTAAAASAGAVAATVSPRPRSQRSNSADKSVEIPQFLKACFLCKRRLTSGRDIYMYRGDSAFCSPECRQRQMKQDEKKEKCSLFTKKEAPTIVPASEVASNGETLAAL